MKDLGLLMSWFKYSIRLRDKYLRSTMNSVWIRLFINNMKRNFKNILSLNKGWSWRSIRKKLIFSWKRLMMKMSIWMTFLKCGAKCRLWIKSIRISHMGEIKQWVGNLLKLLVAWKLGTMLIIVSWNKSKILKHFLLWKNKSFGQSERQIKRPKPKSMKKIKIMNKKRMNFFPFISKRIKK